MATEIIYDMDGQYGYPLLESKPWKLMKVFVANRLRKMAQIPEELAIEWRNCPSEMNLADLGSRGISLSKMEAGGLYTGPQWLLKKEDWPEKPSFKSTARMKEEETPLKESILYTTGAQAMLEHS